MSLCVVQCPVHLPSSACTTKFTNAHVLICSLWIYSAVDCMPPSIADSLLAKQAFVDSYFAGPVFDWSVGVVADTLVVRRPHEQPAQKATSPLSSLHL